MATSNPGAPQAAALDASEDLSSEPQLPYDDDGVDLELIREALARSPLERLRHLAQWQRSAAWLRRARPVTD